VGVEIYLVLLNVAVITVINGIQYAINFCDRARGEICCAW